MSETEELQDEAEQKSIFIGNLHYASTKDEITEFFKECGEIKRITIIADRYTGVPKGYGYVEFVSSDSVDQALALNDTIFHNRQIKITHKKANTPGVRGRGRRMMRRGFSYGRGKYSYKPF